MKILLYSIFFVFSLTAFAQNDDSSPPPLNPYDSPWGEPSSPPIQPPGGNFGDNGPSPPPSDPFGQPPSDMDDYDDDYGPPGFGQFPGNGGSSGQEGQGKSSFMLVAPSDVDECQSWGNAILNSKSPNQSAQSFKDFNDCQFHLERKLEQTRSAIEQSVDVVERYKLKQMLRGEIDNEMRKKNQVQFPLLEARLQIETKQGCICVKN